MRPGALPSPASAEAEHARGCAQSYRRAEAKRRRIKPYQIFQNRTLTALCEERPSSEQQLLSIWGLGDERVAKYGRDLLALIEGNGAPVELAKTSGQAAGRADGKRRRSAKKPAPEQRLFVARDDVKPKATAHAAD